MKMKELMVSDMGLNEGEIEVVVKELDREGWWMVFEVKGVGGFRRGRNVEVIWVVVEVEEFDLRI